MLFFSKSKSLFMAIFGLIFTFSIPLTYTAQEARAQNTEQVLTVQQQAKKLAQEKARRKAIQQRAKQIKAQQRKAAQQRAKQIKIQQRKAAQQRANQVKAQQRKAAQQRANQVKAQQRKAAQQRANQVKAQQLKAAQQRANQVKAQQRKAAQQRANQVKAQQLKAAQQRANQVKAQQLKAAQQRANQVKAQQLKAAQQRANQVKAQQRKAAQQRANQAKAQQRKAARQRANQVKAQQLKAAQQRANQAKAQQRKAARQRANQKTINNATRPNAVNAAKAQQRALRNANRAKKNTALQQQRFKTRSQANTFAEKQRRRAEIKRLRDVRKARRQNLVRQKVNVAPRNLNKATNEVVSRTRKRRKNGSLEVVEQGRNGKILNRRVIAARDARKVRRALNAPAGAVTSGTRRNADGSTTIVRRRADGARVRIVRDRNGNVIRRRVERDNRRTRGRRDRSRVVDSARHNLGGGTTKTVRHFADGSRVVVIRDIDGYVISRRVFDPYGYEQRYLHNGHRRRVRYYDRDINIFLSLPLPIPVDRYVVEDRYASEDMIEEAFLAPPVYLPERAYTVDEVTQDTSLRSSVRRVDLDTITFSSGDDRVPEFQISKLERFANIIKNLVQDDPNEVFLIEGHTDAIGEDDMNLDLSVRRANSVRQALVDTFDVPASNLVAEGYGEDYLKIPTQSSELRNRRVTMRRITPLLNQASNTN